MGDGLAIGFAVSHWYAHLVLSFVDTAIRSNNRKVFLVRFMDNFVMTCGRKRTLHRVVRLLFSVLAKYGLTLKSDWQVFPIETRPIEFLSYRMNHKKTILRKQLMFRMARRFKKAKDRMNAHAARVVMSYRGILKHCGSYHFRQKYLYPNVNIKLCKELISNDDKRYALCR